MSIQIILQDRRSPLTNHLRMLGQSIVSVPCNRKLLTWRPRLTTVQDSG